MEKRDVRLTDEMLEKLKDSVGFEISANFGYVPKAYREKTVNGEYFIPKSLWPLITLKSKNGLEIAEIEDKIGYSEYRDGSMFYHTCSGSYRIATLEKGIKKIKGLPLENGKCFLDYDLDSLRVIIRDESGVVISDTKLSEAKELLKYIKASLQVELQNAINERSTLTEEEKRGLEF